MNKSVDRTSAVVNGALYVLLFFPHEQKFFLRSLSTSPRGIIEKLGAKVIVQSANSDDTRQVRDVESLISRGVDVLVIVPHNGSAMTRAVKSANQAKIPVISYDRLILNADVDYYLSFDNVKVGQTQASYLVQHLPKDRPARIVRIYGAPTDNNAKLFKQGQDEILDPLIKSGVTGQDAYLAACQRILRGTQSMTVYKPLKNLATNAARVAFAVARGEKPPTTSTTDNGLKKVPSIFENVIAVDKDNLESTVIADGFHSAASLK